SSLILSENMRRLPLTRSLFPLLLCICSTLLAQTNPLVDVGIYSDEGAWEAGIIALEHFLDWKGLSHQRVDASVVNTDDLRSRFRSVLFPGGYAYDYKRKLTARGEQHIRELVSDGGAYIGICAGAYFAATRVEWEEGVYPYTLGLFHGTARGSLTQIAPWPGYSMTPIVLRKSHAITAYQRDTLSVLYYGGPSFIPEVGFAIDTIAVWAHADGECAIVGFDSGSGRVLLIGPHPEIEENDTRDGNEFGAELFDPETDWGFLWACFDWALGRPVKDTLLTRVKVPESPGLQDLVVMEFRPNPVREKMELTLSSSMMTTIRLSIVDLYGRTVTILYEGDLRSGVSSFRFPIRGSRTPLSPGMYFVHIVAGKTTKSLPFHFL
ncbi:MAG: BPL-N domain-containing protein, partial [Bacteroidota bacterium]|nr:BPL-N domain-containing protein [Bacteroidota bacterium]